MAPSGQGQGFLGSPCFASPWDGNGTITKGLASLSGVGVVNAAPRESQFTLSVPAALCTSSLELGKAAWGGDESGIINSNVAKCFWDVMKGTLGTSE